MSPPQRVRAGALAGMVQAAAGGRDARKRGGDWVVMVDSALLLFLAHAPGSAPVEIYRDPDAGFAMKLSGGFRFLKRHDTLTIFGSGQTPGIVTLKSGESFSSAELAEAARSGYQAEGVSLQPERAAVRLTLAQGEGLVFPVKGLLDGSTVRGILAGLRAPSGRCFIVLAATTPEAWPRPEPAARSLIEGVSLEAPETRTADSNIGAYFAKARFSFYMSRTSTSSAGSREGSFSGVERIYFCSDGIFLYHEQAQGAFEVPQAMGSAAVSDNGSGRWQASATTGGATVTLSFHNGRWLQYLATRLGRETVHLNGSRCFRAGHSRCQ